MLGHNDNEIVIALPDALIKTVKEIAKKVELYHCFLKLSRIAFLID